jgi:hypothetical protein
MHPPPPVGEHNEPLQYPVIDNRIPLEWSGMLYGFGTLPRNPGKRNQFDNFVVGAGQDYKYCKDNMDESLDEIIADKARDYQRHQGDRRSGKSGRGGGGGSSVGKARSPTGREERKSEPYHPSVLTDDARRYGPKHITSYKQQEFMKHIPQPQRFANPPSDAHSSLSAGATGCKTVFDRIGLREAPASIIISNVYSSISTDDVTQLCSIYGAPESVAEIQTSSAKSTKTYAVQFAYRSAALACISKYNGCNVLGRDLIVQLVGDGTASEGGVTNFRKPFRHPSEPLVNYFRNHAPPTDVGVTNLPEELQLPVPIPDSLNKKCIFIRECHEHIIEIAKRAVVNGAPAVLLTGPQGNGKVNIVMMIGCPAFCFTKLLLL